MIDAALVEIVARALEPLAAELRALRAELAAQARPERWASCADTARALGITRRALDARRRRGGIPADAVRRHGARWLFDLAKLGGGR